MEIHWEVWVDMPGMREERIKITLDSKIHITAPFSIRKRYPALMRELRKLVVLENPEYSNAEKFGRSTWGVRRRISLWSYNLKTQTLSLPRGMMPELLDLLHSLRIDFQVTDNRAILEGPEFHSKIVLREYQTPAVEAMVEAGGGILVAPAGSGKTAMGMEIIARLNQPALWLTHTQDLAGQAIGAGVKFLGLKQNDIGMVGAGQNHLGPLTIGIIQTLNKRDLTEIAQMFGIVFVDETHHGAAPTWSEIVNQMPARYRYGVTATPERADGLSIITERIIGPVIYEVPREEVDALGGTIRPRLVIIKTECQPEIYKLRRKQVKWRGAADHEDPRVPFPKLLSDVLNDEQRNLLIIETIIREAPGHFTLVLSERVAHCKHLLRLLREAAPGIRAEMVHGAENKGIRQEILKRMNAGKIDVLFAVDIAKEGLDIPRLDRLHIVGGGRNENEIEQKVGRIQRPFPGKEDAIVFDYLDVKIPSLQSQFRARRKVYRRLGINQIKPGERKMPEAISMTKMSEDMAQKALDRLSAPMKYCVTCRDGVIIEREVWCCLFEREGADECRKNGHSGWRAKIKGGEPEKAPLKRTRFQRTRQKEKRKDLKLF